jgi:hypothetical protein
MHIFIDESGSFSGYHNQSVSVVGALAIPDGKLDLIKRKYAKIRARFPLENGEVKGRQLDERQIDEVVTMLARNDAIFEISALDLGFQKESDLVERKRKHAEEMSARAARFREPDRQLVENACRQISDTSLPLYLQSIVTFEVLHSIINYVPTYFAQRQPKELGTFTWVIDGKESIKVTNWEMWLSWYARGALATMSIGRPAPTIEGADYSYYRRFDGPPRLDEKDELRGTDTKLLLADLRFSSETEPGLELVDIVVNATRRALIGSLGEAGWHNIPKLMIHRNEPYIKLIILAEGGDEIHHPPYARIVNTHFSAGGRPMLTASIMRGLNKQLR